MTHAMIVVDDRGRVTYWDPGAEFLFGHPAATVLGRLVDVIVPEALRSAHWAGFRRAMADPQLKDMAADLPVLCADGQDREFAGRLLALSDGLGRGGGAIAIYADDDSTGVRPFSSGGEAPPDEDRPHSS